MADPLPIKRRGVSARDLESTVLHLLVGLGELERVGGQLINRDHPACYWADETGTYMVTVEKVSGATVQKTVPATDVTPE